MDDGGTREAKVISRIVDIPAEAWDRLANPEPALFNPFVAHAFLAALETAGTTGAETGWLPQHIVLENAAGAIEAAMPLYVKSHSRGEYVFDHAFADAYHRAGGRYYPKLQVAVPFTPVPGPRLLIAPEADRENAEIYPRRRGNDTGGPDRRVVGAHYVPAGGGVEAAWSHRPFAADGPTIPLDERRLSVLR